MSASDGHIENTVVPKIDSGEKEMNSEVAAAQEIVQGDNSEDDFESLLSSSNSETVRKYEAYNRMDGCSSDEDTKTDNDESNDDDIDISENQYTAVNDDAYEFGEFTAACTETLIRNDEDKIDSEDGDENIEPDIPASVYRSIPPLSEEKIAIIKSAMQSFTLTPRSGADSIFQVISQSKIRIGDELNTMTSNESGSTECNIVSNNDVSREN